MTSIGNRLTESAAVDAISKPPPGVVLPPKEIRTILEKTAGYVARNGTTFEDRIRNKEKSNPKFSFLTENDAYHAFYQWRLSEVKAGRGTSVSAGREAGDAAAAAEKPAGPKPPPEFHFSARMPNISAQDLDVLKLTAFFVAKNGRSFMTTLSQRESTNFQFDFLRPQHTLNSFFSRLVDQYSELLNARGSNEGQVQESRMLELTKNSEDKYHILDRAKRRAEWVRLQAQQKQQKEEEAEAEKTAYAQIDWHDFVIAEIVVFTETDVETDLPPPTSLSDLQSASLEQKADMSLQPNHMRVEEAMPTDETYYQQQPPQLPLPPSHQQQRQISSGSPLATMPSTSSTMPPPATPIDHATRPASTGPMKIRSDYVPRAQAQRKSVLVSICPNCRQEIPSDELSEHMRIELLDPRWREQRAKAESRHSTTNLSTADVANNLKRLASQRTDVFDNVTGEALSQEEAARRKRAATGYDGLIAGINDGSVGPGQAGTGKPALQAQARESIANGGRSIEEQLKHIHEKARSS